MRKSVIVHSTIKRMSQFCEYADKISYRLEKIHQNSGCNVTLIIDESDHHKVKINAFVADFESTRGIEFDYHMEIELALRLIDTLETFVISDYEEYLKTTKA